MDTKLERGKGPFTAYVDGSFRPEICQKWATVNTAKSPMSGDLEDVVQARDHRQLKTFIRSGSWQPMDATRRLLWWRVCCVTHKDTGSASIYEDTVNDVFGQGSSAHMVTMPAFVDLSMKLHYHISEPGIHVAKRVVCILATTCPDIAYAPLVFPLTCLMLHYMDEGDAYNCMYGLVRAPGSFLAQTRKAHQVMKYVLKDLTHKYAKQFYSFLSKKGLQAEGVMEDWAWWIFRDLPFCHLVRVVDCYLVEGPKVLYRVALAIMNLFYKHIVKLSGKSMDSNIQRAICLFCEEFPLSPEKLLKLAFGLRGLSRKEIRRYQIKSEIYVESLRHSAIPLSIPKSGSCDSLNLKVSRSFSGPINLQSVSSSLLKPGQWQRLWKWLPTRITLHHPVLLYTSNEHGTSLRTFYAKVEGREPMLLVIKTSHSEVFGAYCSNDWAERPQNKSYFGTGESFVFQLSPRVEKYSWVGLEQQQAVPATSCLFLRGDNTSLNIGGGNGVAISVDENLYQGRSQRCNTFNNPVLSAGGDFKCFTVEAFGFE